ncbi:tumor necrosis factor receptor superfamily member 26-like isoform X2 [Mastomys coucha]|uniref:tumor necrosis factor receptor superfamily member 26-like isoform X2 n=1 Tax=Mastomys coucha TaxID=35658 RepID=UPI00126155D8|nr:tumor necrosis factor receptor superfamily member 26-like isoform X2 [Mastomys coucha]
MPPPRQGQHLGCNRLVLTLSICLSVLLCPTFLMMARLRLLLLLGMLLRVTVCSVSNTTQCEKGEFKHENLYCQCCSPGTYLIKPCQKNHGTSECAPCDSKHFIDHKNREAQCSLCSVCRDDQEEVVKCSDTTDRVCQCKQGTYCNSENCLEKCYTCSSCPNGRVLRKCNATMDTVCDTDDSEPAPSGSQCFCFPKPLNIVVIVAAFIIIIAAVITVFVIMYKIITRRRDKTALNSVNSSPTGSGNTGEKIQLSSTML